MLDASVVVSAAIGPDTPPRQAVVATTLDGRFALSDSVMREYRDVLSRPKLLKATTASGRDWILSAITANAVWFDPHEPVTDCRDPKDNKYLDLALAAQAAAIISGDADLLVLDPWRSCRILNPAAFLLWRAPR